jgi:acyl-CoA synthetase (AMP-forming)/AMP-acid ligase II
VLKKGMELLGPVFIQAYGQSESGPLVSNLSRRAHMLMEEPTESQKILASCGQPCPGVHVRIVDVNDQDVALGDVGEIVVKSKSLMQKYWKRPDEKDMIISGGENVYPREVEEVLYQHPAIEEAAVIGVPDAYWIEIVHAVVVLKQGASADEKGIIDFCKEKLARYKSPKSVNFVETLPKNPQGKILKRELRKLYPGGN